MPLPTALAEPRVTAVTGPTNTGKTHHAIERMLLHPSGMIGLPLRLLAREVYERVVSRKGALDVALITGEEKIIPAGARYWVCTVEAMPVEKRVAFVAVDEIQLCASRQRGRLFTERLLAARGLLETMFLGSDTMAPIIARLLPKAEHASRPRLSKLSWTGVSKLSALPKRSAIIAFSADQVYQLAERVRARRGGAAVVLGALSPRARNAQVAMYQAGEVDTLVATDAIGMGLNLDIDHVAFSALRKFDGHRHRALQPPELAQIAGRAGRHLRDGTFGCLKGAGTLDPDVVERLEHHAFTPVERLYWRNPDLDFRSIDSLLTSLRKRSPRRELIQVKDGEDHRVLEDLAADDEVRRATHSTDDVALLWEVCGVPDYRKTLTGAHAEQLKRVYLFLREGGELPDDWIRGRVQRLDRTDGDIETLMARIAYTRTWTYLAYRTGWMRDSPHWQERTRVIEDKLSDALHDRLTARFVDTRGRSSGTAIAATPRAWQEAPLDIDHEGRVQVQGRQVARLLPSSDVFRPLVRVIGMNDANAETRQVLRRRVERRVAGAVHGLVGPVQRLPDGLHHAGRAVAYALERGLGLARSRELREPLARLTPDERQLLGDLGVEFRQGSVWLRQAMSDRGVRWRVLLWALHERIEPMPRLPDAGLETLAPGQLPARVLEVAGYMQVGPLAVRLDLAP